MQSGQDECSSSNGQDGPDQTTSSEEAVIDRKVPPVGRCLFLEMPGEILSQIASYLPLDAVVPFLSLHPRLLSLTQSHLSPLPPLIRSVLSTPPYPTVLSVLPHLPHFIPPDPGDAERLFVQILVRARPKWILERFEAQRWDDKVWQEAFERRFLGSWKRLKGEDDTWRAVFLRTLGRIEHRQAGCTHEEAWTVRSDFRHHGEMELIVGILYAQRFVTLHRNGSASINRIYSRTFDPYEIYDELKHQNNFSAHPTTVRVVLHLQDVRILAVGVLIDQPSLFVNPNAHLALHPPLLRHLSQPRDDADPAGSRWFRPAQGRGSDSGKRKVKGPSASPGATTNEAYFPLVRSMSPSTHSTTYGLSAGGGAGTLPVSIPSDRAGPSNAPFAASPPQSPTVGSFRSTLASYIPIPGRRRTSSVAGEHSSPTTTGSSFGAVLTHVRSRDSDEGRRRTWSLGRVRSGSGSGPSATPGPTTASQSAALTGDSDAWRLVTDLRTADSNGAGTIAARELASMLPNLDEVPATEDEEYLSVPVPPSEPETRLHDRPYDLLEKPQPAVPHARYPNFTPPESGYDIKIDDHDHPHTSTTDLRSRHPEVEDEYEGGLWGGDVPWGAGGMRMAEWDDRSGKRRRWVGPMILVAQLHPSTRSTPRPAGVDPTRPVEGANPDLGPKGMYLSLGFEDVEALFPWVELKGSGAWNGEAKRSGLGF